MALPDRTGTRKACEEGQVTVVSSQDFAHTTDRNTKFAPANLELFGRLSHAVYRLFVCVWPLYPNAISSVRHDVKRILELSVFLCVGCGPRADLLFNGYRCQPGGGGGAIWQPLPSAVYSFYVPWWRARHVFGYLYPFRLRKECIIVVSILDVPGSQLGRNIEYPDWSVYWPAEILGFSTWGLICSFCGEQICYDILSSSMTKNRRRLY
jgi:hypothetical protein